MPATEPPVSVADLAAELSDRADARTGRRLLVGIAGRPGAGKSTLAEALVAELGARAVVVAMDGFHLADAVLDALGRRDRKGAPDTFDPRGLAALLQRLRTEPGPIHAPAFERTLEQPLAQAVRIDDQSIVITEGNYLLVDHPDWERIRAQLDLVWWIDGDEQQRITDLTERHIRFGKSPEQAAAWVARVDQPNAELAAASAPRADRRLVRPT
ncbi:MAG TPA: nucleoside/nucleotide kinase family protein [Candidatus Avipropionibacterium avicola]|uniref:Nucleoside/nucleotide kinase family protein n=1 Tax=Candidatus Avipropionibacterium avicola TaxID=2840701 RepID=A0A9D1KLL9_9ACTN|nr:nucleoside/nucleotide kinase family protein [Candidatus Avipropionibacterium avicola]